MSFEEYRPLLFGVAYRMTGSAMEAEDIVQEGWLRYQSVPPDTIRHAKAYLVQVVTRLALDHLKAARTQRETYIGPWLPEPILTSDSEQEADETVSLAFLTLLERLTPVERAVFLLREVFDYDYRDIAPIVERSESTCRQLFRRAKSHLSEQARFRPSIEEHTALLSTFIEVLATGQLHLLETLLAEDVAMYSDGGGKVTAARKPLFGSERVATFWRGLVRNAPPNVRIAIRTVNGLPALLLWVDEVLNNVITIEMAEGKVTAMRTILNPDKLEYIKGQL
jgi:RNA polymerase sigma-70 factor (ECF subfamily)